jgi:hypothetical protein
LLNWIFGAAVVAVDAMAAALLTGVPAAVSMSVAALLDVDVMAVVVACGAEFWLLVELLQ